jgi:hypothetical protein
MIGNVFLDINLNTVSEIDKSNQIAEFREYLEHILQLQDIDVFISKILADELADEDIDEYFNNSISQLSPVILQTEKWENKQIHDSILETYHYYQWNGLGAISQNLLGTLYAEIAERQLSYETNCLLICPFKEIAENIYIIRDFISSNKESNFTQLHYTYLFDIKKFNHWYDSVKKNRLFRHNTKHDPVPDNKKRKAKDGSPINRLLCDEHEAQELLLMALSDQRERKMTKKLFYIDDFQDSKGKGLIIEFMPEKEGIYHAYHLEDITDIRAIDTLNYIPSELKEALKEKMKSYQKSQRQS